MAEDKKNKRRAYAPKAKPPPGPRLPDGVPIDPQTGLPMTDVPIDREELRRIGAFDAESAQVTQEFRNRLAAKQRGERVTFNSEQQVAIEEMLAEYPTARIFIKQVSPKEDDNIPSRPLSFIRDFEGLRKYIVDSHWNRKDAVYQWAVRAKGHPQIGTGKIVFAEVEEMQQGNGNGYGGYPGAPPHQGYLPPQGYPQGYPPGYPPQQYPGYPPQQFQYPGYPPQYAQLQAPAPAPYPPPQYAQPQQPQAPAPQAAPAPASAPAPQSPSGPQMPGQPLFTPEGALVGWNINGITYWLAPQSGAQGAAAAQQPAPPPPQPPVAAPPPAQAAPNGDFQMFLVTKLLEMSNNNAQFMEQMRGMYEQRQQQQHVQAPYPYPPFMPPPQPPPQYPGMVAAGYGYPPGFVVGAPQQVPPQQPAPAAPAAAPPAEPPAPPPTPMQVMAQGLRDAKTQIALVQDFTETVRDFAGGGGVADPAASPIAPPTVPDDDMPLRTREVNGVTIGSIDGEMMSPTEIGLLNAPKIVGLLGGLADRFLDRIDKVKNEAADKQQKEIERRRAEVELEEREQRARIEAQKQKVEFETERLKIRAAHAHLDAMGVVVPDPPPPPSPPVPQAAPPPPPPPPTTQEAPPQPPAATPEEEAKQPENVAVAAPPSSAVI